MCLWKAKRSTSCLIFLFTVVVWCLLRRWSAHPAAEARAPLDSHQMYLQKAAAAAAAASHSWCGNSWVYWTSVSQRCRRHRTANVPLRFCDAAASSRFIFRTLNKHHHDRERPLLCWYSKNAGLFSWLRLVGSSGQLWCRLCFLAHGGRGGHWLTCEQAQRTTWLRKRCQTFVLSNQDWCIFCAA